MAIDTLGYFNRRWDIAVLILSVPPMVLTLRWICKEWVCKEKSKFTSKQLHLIPATISMILYIISAAFILAGDFSQDVIFYQVGGIYVWATAEIGIHLFFIIHIYEEFHDNLNEDDPEKLQLQLQKKEKRIMFIFMAIFYISQLYMGTNAILLHYDVLDDLTANWSDLWMAVLSLLFDTAICIYLLKVYGLRLTKINNEDNKAFETLAKYYLLLGVATIDTAISLVVLVIDDSIHVHNRSQDLWVQSLSIIDQLTYLSWSFDVVVNMYQIYLNIEPGEQLYTWCCVKPGCEKCVKSRFINQQNDVALLVNDANQ